MLFRQAIPRRALYGAIVGFVYSLLILPTGTFLGVLYVPAIGWFLLSIALLFARPFAYYTYVTWALLWLVWRGVLAFRGEAGPIFAAMLDVAFPLASIGLLSSSGYLEAVAPPEADEA
ncbi:MAG TPA: hypothetical protein VM370_11385 [Candidatus Thermoplasmatota archaeon]|nr:hypothetical protein [Candidatus Thermoplasmatota archaeon]